MAARKTTTKVRRTRDGKTTWAITTSSGHEIIITGSALHGYHWISRRGNQDIHQGHARQYGDALSAAVRSSRHVGAR